MPTSAEEKHEPGRQLGSPQSKTREPSTGRQQQFGGPSTTTKKPTNQKRRLAIGLVDGDVLRIAQRVGNRHTRDGKLIAILDGILLFFLGGFVLFFFKKKEEQLKNEIREKKHTHMRNAAAPTRRGLDPRRLNRRRRVDKWRRRRWHVASRRRPNNGAGCRSLRVLLLPGYLLTEAKEMRSQS